MLGDRPACDHGQEANRVVKRTRASDAIETNEILDVEFLNPRIASNPVDRSGADHGGGILPFQFAVMAGFDRTLPQC